MIREVIGFARDYINNRYSRSAERKRKIRIAYKQLTGGMVGSCATCYIEALMIIIKRYNMASTRYVLKKGAILQTFGEPKKTLTNAKADNELADWYYREKPDTRMYFDSYIPPKPEVLKAEPKKEAPKKEAPIPEVKTAIEEAVDMIGNVPEAKVAIKKPRAKKKPSNAKT